MSDAAVAEVKTPEATRAGVLAGARHEVKASTVATVLGGAAAGSEAEKLAKALSMAESARKAGTEHPADLRAQLVDVSKVSRFTDADSAALKNIISPSGTNARAETALTGLTDIIRYNEAARTADATGKGIDTVVGGDWDRLHKEVVSRIVNDGNLLSKFPGISEITNTDHRALLIEELIARDPRLQNEISAELTRIASEAKDQLKPDPQADELKRTLEERDNLSELQTEQITIIRNELAAQGVPADKIDSIIKTANTGDAGFAVQRTFDAIVAAKGIKNTKYIESYQKQTTDIASAEKDKADIQKQLNDELRKTKGRNADLITSLGNQLTEKDTKITEARNAQNRTKDFYKTTYSVDDAGFETDIQSYRDARAVLDTESSFNRAIQYATSNGLKLKEAEAKLATLNGNAEITARASERKKASEKLTSDLENAVSTAMGRFMEKKYADFITDEQTRLGAAAKEAAHKGEKNQEKNLKKLKDEIKKFGHIDKTSRKIVRDRQKIGDKMKEFAYYAGNGEDGKKHLIASEIGFKIDKEEGRNEISSTLFSGRAYDTLNDEEKAKVDADYTKQSADFDKLVTEHGDAYMKSLVSNFIAERGKLDRTVFGKPMGSLALTSDEWKTVYPLLTPMIDNELANNKAGKRMMGELRAKGIVPDSKMKWLIWALLAAGIGTIGAVGILPAAAAIGAAAPVVGGAALTGIA